MSAAFNNIPNDPDTTVLFQHEGVFDDLPVCYQAWSFDGIKGESIIFQNQDLQGQEDRLIIKKVKDSSLVDKNKSITISRNNPDFVFVNFNFEVV